VAGLRTSLYHNWDSPPSPEADLILGSVPFGMSPRMWSIGRYRRSAEVRGKGLVSSMSWHLWSRAIERKPIGANIGFVAQKGIS